MRHATIDLSSLMMLPGVIVSSREDRRDDDQLWDFVHATIVKAIENLNEMRGIEGSHMAETLEVDCGSIGEQLDLDPTTGSPSGRQLPQPAGD